MALVDEDVPILGSDEVNNEFEDNRSRKWPQLVATLVACLSPLTMGFVLGYSSPTMAELVGDGLLTQPQATWFGSLVTIGAISGGPLAAVFVEKVGRKTTLMLICLPYTVGWLFIILADNYIFLFAGRLITGLSVGATSLATPLYIAEVASKEMRGFLGAGFQLFVVAGIEVVYCLGIVLNFRWLAVSAVAISALQILCLCCMPETPRWLLGTMQRNKALDALRWLRGPDYPIEDECFDIETNMEAQSEEEFSLKDFARPSLYHPLTISIFLMIFQQFSGVNAVIFYSADIMESAGFGENAKVAAVAIGGVQVVATAIACCLMDAAGRRLLLLIAGIFMTLSCVTFGTYYYLVDVHKIGGLSWLSLGSLILYVTAFSLGWGPIPWLIMSEVFPGRAKGMASGIVTTVNWCCAFLVTKEFHDLQVAITEYGVFWLFGSICALSIAFVAIFVPETKGRSLEEIEATFNHRSIST